MAINENRQRWGINMWMTVIALIAVIVAAAMGWFGRWGRSVTADAVKAGDVAANGISYYGKEMKIHGYVSDPMSGRLLMISDAVKGTVQLPVLVRGPAVAVTLGQEVIVEGIPTAFDSARIRQDYGIAFAGEATRGWEGRPAVIAGKVHPVN